MLDSKLQFAFRLIGAGRSSTLVDPRAARLEYNLKSRTHDGRVNQSEMQPLTVCNPELVESKIDFIETPRLAELPISYCLPADAYVEGLMSNPGASYVNI